MHALACAPFCTNRDWGSAAPSLAVARVLFGSTSKRWTLLPLMVVPAVRNGHALKLTGAVTQPGVAGDRSDHRLA